MATLTAMDISHEHFVRIIARSQALTSELELAFGHPPFERQPRYEASQTAASLAFEHGMALRCLIVDGFGPSAAVVLRSQYEATLRSVWLCYCADEVQVTTFSTELSNEDATSDKALPQAADMLKALEDKAPPAAIASLSNFRKHSWSALNSFVHAGLHPIKRHRGGLPLPLAAGILRNSNGLSVIAAMQAAVAAGSRELVSVVLAAQDSFVDCCS